MAVELQLHGASPKAATKDQRQFNTYTSLALETFNRSELNGAVLVQLELGQMYLSKRYTVQHTPVSTV